MVVLLVIFTFLACTVIYALVQKSKQGALMASLEMTAPVIADYRFTPGHLWLNKLKSGHFHLGLDELILRFVGDPDKIHLIEAGEKVKAGEPLAILCKGNKEVYIRAPADATIIETNPSLVGQPQSINADLYRRGWLYQIDLTDSGLRVNSLLKGDRARVWINKELARLKEFIVANQPIPALVGNTLLDGGELIGGVIERLDQTAVSEFEKRFLSEEIQGQ